MATENDIVIELSEPQSAILSSRASVLLNMAGQGAGKSKVIGYSTGQMILEFPRLIGFIGANTHLQLSQSTLARVFETWREVYGLEEYDEKQRPHGVFVVDKRPPSHFRRMHWLRKYEGTISFWNGALIYIGSLENYKAHDGKEFAWAHLDETKDTEEAALKDVILGRLRQYGLWYDKYTSDLHLDINKDSEKPESWVAWNPLHIHTSPALDGVDWLNKMFKLSEYAQDIKAAVMQEERAFFNCRFGNKEVVIYSTHHNAHNLPPNYIANQKENLGDDDKILMLIYGYPFGKSGGEYYTNYRRDLHVKPVPFNPALPVHQGWDFNVVPYMTCIPVQFDEVVKFIDQAGIKYDRPAEGREMIEVTIIKVYTEYCLPDPQNTTEAVCNVFAEDHDPDVTEIYYYGDASGLNRIPGMGSKTNFRMIEDTLYMFMHNGSKKVKAPNVAPLKRRDLLNAIFAGRHPDIEIEIDPECVKLIEDLENVKLGNKGKVKKRKKDDKTGEMVEKHGHPSDALEYIISEVFKDRIK